MSVIRVVSYNIHKGRSATGGRESLADLRLGLYGLHPDLLFLQEVQGRNQQRLSLDTQHEYLAAALDMHAAYGCNAVRPHTDHGNALLSRFPILQHENQDISDHRLEQRGLLHALIEIDDASVHCLVVHLGLFAGGRSRQVAALVERIKRLVPADEPMLIAGDFNDWSNRLAPLFVQQLGLYEVFAIAPHYESGPRLLRHSVTRLRNSLRGVQPAPLAANVHELGINGAARMTPPPRTFPAAFPWLRLDRIYQRGFAVRKARVLQGVPWKQISDHAPLYAELELP
ncbi:endonuclease/exonuclease/phosphatase family protein [Pollutimonas harenae]|uniref:Endonuclease/exonuclease/phosphatase family protein n=1 Tax=Pollutimonas harenae TaxID=657015 RepID=A0A853H0C9_9BURK|nr:endonuclease/exonuclease/phosphatase family protein [Pollutimonas harenae]NYT84735.1 endonuclease/exonuclease/phosphatase family protein [Pollutimonas harenae]TEA72864.1 endonuclease [Pollutimonas harenae]